jgi:hypothetical protein
MSQNTLDEIPLDEILFTKEGKIARMLISNKGYANNCAITNIEEIEKEIRLRFPKGCRNIFHTIHNDSPQLNEDLISWLAKNGYTCRTQHSNELIIYNKLL